MQKENVTEKRSSDTVLVAVDGSLPAQMAASTAIQLAQGLGLAVHGLYVVDETLVLDPYANYEPELGRKGDPASHAQLISWFEEQGAAALEWVQERCQTAGVSVYTEVLFGGVPELVMENAAGSQLLALGRRGNSHSAEPHHLGDNFKIVAHQVRQPVLIGGDEAHPIRHVLLAYNGSTHAQHALAQAVALQRTLQPQIDVLVVTEDDPSEQRITKIEDDLAAQALTDYHLLQRQGNPAEVIVTVSAEQQVDLVLMGRYRHAAVLEWLTGSTLEQVLTHTPVPVLIA